MLIIDFERLAFFNTNMIH